jgi:hypothetical protein
MTHLPVNQKTRIRIIQLSVLALLFAVMTMNPGFNADGSDTIEKMAWAWCFSASWAGCGASST